ncbi:hypothetical protein [uncultured Helicobacter sp.]
MHRFDGLGAATTPKHSKLTPKNPTKIQKKQSLESKVFMKSSLIKI